MSQTSHAAPNMFGQAHRRPPSAIWSPGPAPWRDPAWSLIQRAVINVKVHFVSRCPALDSCAHRLDHALKVACELGRAGCARCVVHHLTREARFARFPAKRSQRSARTAVRRCQPVAKLVDITPKMNAPVDFGVGAPKYLPPERRPAPLAQGEGGRHRFCGAQVKKSFKFKK